MKIKISLLLILLIVFVNAQQITLSKALKTSQNSDKFFYLINPNLISTEYLGEVEVDGYSTNDPEVFSQIYKKAKIVGANSFALNKTETLDGIMKKANLTHYKLDLFYTKEFPKEDNSIYIFSSGSKNQLIRINTKKVILKARSYIKKNIDEDKIESISSGSLLGSKINVSSKKNQPTQYFQILSMNLRPNQTGEGGLTLKSGDIIGLEKSYANFLQLIYSQQ